MSVPILKIAARGARDVTTDDDLVTRARAGDGAAFADLYRVHADTVYRRVTRLVGPDPEREDLIQQIFLDAYRALPSFRGDAAFSTFLYRITVNAATDHLRRRGRRRREILTGQEDLAAHVCGWASPGDRAACREQVDRVLRCLDRLKPKKRVVLILSVVEGLSAEAIAPLVDAKAPAVRQRLREARKDLRAMLARAERRGGHL